MGILNEHDYNAYLTSAGQPTAHEFSLIAERGFQAVVNLAMHDSPGALTDESYQVVSRGMDYLHIPVNFETPTQADLKKFLHIMALYREQPVFVHCALNLRASVFSHAYLVHTGQLSFSQSSALQEWLPNMPLAWQELMSLTQEQLATLSPMA